MEKKLSSIISMIGTAASAGIVLIGTGVGWGAIQSRMDTVEFQSKELSSYIQRLDDKKADKSELQYINTDIDEIKRDIKLILQRLR